MDFDLGIIAAAVIAGATPIVVAAIGETITEKSGLINLSLDGSILLSAMVAFAVALRLDSLVAGYAAGALAGAAVAGLLAVFTVFLRQDQVAVGFVLALTTRDLAYFLGNAVARAQGPNTVPLPVPLLEQIPLLGEALFRHHLPVYLSLILIAACWWFMFRTRPGLDLRAVGENPQAAFARGIDPRRVQVLCALCGGALVGVAGAAFSLTIKPGWGRPQGSEGMGWIALALVIFGGWHPVRAAAGAYLFSFLQIMGIYFQGWLPSVPAQVFQVAPFPLMIFTLLVISLAQSEYLLRRAERKPWIKGLMRLFAGLAPASLGKPHRRD